MQRIIKKMKVNKVFKNISSGHENMADLYEGNPKVTKETRDLIYKMTKKEKESKSVEFKEQIQPFWKMYIVFWYSILKPEENKSNYKKTIDDFFETKFSKKDLEKTFKQIDEGFKDSKLIKATEKINLDEKIAIKYTILTNTTIGKEFWNKFVKNINKNIKRLNLSNKIGDLKNNQLKIDEELINTNLVLFEKMFTNKLIDLYLESKLQNLE